MFVKRPIVVLKLLAKGCTLVPVKYSVVELSDFLDVIRKVIILKTHFSS